MVRKNMKTKKIAAKNAKGREENNKKLLMKSFWKSVPAKPSIRDIFKERFLVAEGDS